MNSIKIFCLIHSVLFVFHVLYTHNNKTQIITQPSRITHEVVVGHDGEKDILLNDQLSKMIIRMNTIENKVKLADNYDATVKDCRTYNRVMKETKKLLRVTFDHRGNHCVFARKKGPELKVNHDDVKLFLNQVILKRLGK